MRLHIPTLTLAGALLLGACAHPRPTLPMWEKPGVTTTEWFADQSACQRDSDIHAAAVSRGYSADLMAQHFYNRCLEAKGYSRTQ